MRRELLLVAEIIDAAGRIIELTADVSVVDLDRDRDRREALLWSFTVLGEASSQLDDSVKAKYPQVPWQAASASRILANCDFNPGGYSSGRHASVPRGSSSGERRSAC